MGVGGGGRTQLPTFDAETKFAKVPNSIYGGGGGGGGGVEGLGPNFSFLMLSPNMLKSKNIFSRGFALNFVSFLTKISTTKEFISVTKWTIKITQL